MIGSMKDLRSAAMGGRVRSTTSVNNEEKPPPPIETFIPQGQRESASNLAEMLAATGRTGQSFTPTETYRSLIGGRGQVGAGIKYAGFPTEGALKSAIQGGAINMKTILPERLRNEALNRAAQLNTMMGPANKAITRDLFGGTQESYGRFQDFGRRLGGWYEENMRPAQQYAETAQQFEKTPASRLAADIAVSRYGQNFDWASDQFRDLDATFAAEQRNQRYLREQGMPYAEYAAQLTERNMLSGYQEDLANSAIEAATGLKGSYVTGVTARTPQQLVSGGLRAEVKYRDPEKSYEGEMVSQDTGDNVVKRARTLIGDRNFQGAYDLAQSLEEQGYPDAAFIIFSMLKVSGASADLKNKLALSGIVAP